MTEGEVPGTSSPDVNLHGTSPDPAEVPRLEFDELLVQLVERAQDVIATQSRLRGLLAANRAIAGDLALPVVLRRIVAAACELVDAPYGALGIVAPDGGLEQFIHVGVDEDTAARIGHLPQGKGLLGALIDDPRPIRLRTIADDERSVGFPAQHPSMGAFLGVPIRIRSVVFGNLYLTKSEGAQFTPEDEELVLSLAATAATAIDNARLYEEAQRRQAWLQASTEVSQQLLSVDGEQPLSVVARRVAELASADAVTVVLPTADGRRVMVEVAHGAGANEMTATTYPIEGTLSGLAIATGHPVLVGDVTVENTYTVHLSDVVHVGPVMAVPLVGTRGARGALVIGRLHGRPRFTDADLEMATTFANHASVALEFAAARADQQRVALLEDRDRIARDLHDHVIQQLFAAGLSVQGVASGLDADDPRAARLGGIANDIDRTIRQIRTSIFALRGTAGPDVSPFRKQVLDIAGQLTPALGFPPAVTFRGPIDAVVPDELIDDLLAIVREALTNVARHAGASRVDIDISATSSEISVDVIDDGCGIGETTRASGLANLSHRAESQGGAFTVFDHEGTHLRWTIPLP